MSEKILLVGAEPGSVSTLAPIALRDPKRFAIYASARAASGFRQMGLDVQELPDADSSIAAENLIHKCLESEKATKVLSTLIGPLETSLDHALTRVCAVIPSIRHVAVLDSWMNLASRFHYSEGQLCSLPDVVAVPDTNVRAELTELAFPSERIVITGHPFFDRISTFNRRSSERKRIGVILQPISSLAEKEELVHPGYTEADFCDVLFSALQSIDFPYENLEIHLREHPRHPSKYSVPNAFAEMVSTSSEGDGWEFCLSCDTIVGMSGTLLVYAFFAGLPTIVVQPNLSATPDPNILTRYGMLKNCESPELLEKELSSALCESAYQMDSACEQSRQGFKADGSNAERVLELLDRD